MVLRLRPRWYKALYQNLCCLSSSPCSVSSLNVASPSRAGPRAVGAALHVLAPALLRDAKQTMAQGACLPGRLHNALVERCVERRWYSNSATSDPSLEFLAKVGLSSEQLELAQRRYPEIVSLDIETQLEPLTRYFEDKLKLSRKALCTIVSKSPRILSLPLRQIQRNVDWLVELGIHNKAMGGVLREHSAVLFHDIESLQKHVDFLLQNGVERRKLAYVLSLRPQLLTASIDEKMQPAVQWLHSIGVPKDKLGYLLVNAPEVLEYSVEHKLQGTVNWLVQHEVPADRFGPLFARYPKLLGFNFQTRLQATLEELQRLGLRSENVRKAIVSGLVLQSATKLAGLTPKLQTFGLEQEDIAMLLNDYPRVFSGNCEATVLSWVDAGLTYQQAKAMVTKNGEVLTINFSRPVHVAKLEYYSEAGYSLDDIAAHPGLMLYSLDRIRRRMSDAVKRLGSTPPPGEFEEVLLRPELKYRENYAGGETTPDQDDS